MLLSLRETHRFIQYVTSLLVQKEHSRILRLFRIQIVLNVEIYTMNFVHITIIMVESSTVLSPQLISSMGMWLQAVYAVFAHQWHRRLLRHRTPCTSWAEDKWRGLGLAGCSPSLPNWLACLEPRKRTTWISHAPPAWTWVRFRKIYGGSYTTTSFSPLSVSRGKDSWKWKASANACIRDTS